MHNWAEKDLEYIWHPCSQMKDYETLAPIVVERGEGVYLFDENGKRYVDVISSWWCNLLGHCNPRINQAVKNQIDKQWDITTIITSLPTYAMLLLPVAACAKTKASTIKHSFFV